MLKVISWYKLILEFNERVCLWVRWLLSRSATTTLLFFSISLFLTGELKKRRLLSCLRPKRTLRQLINEWNANGMRLIYWWCVSRGASGIWIVSLLFGLLLCWVGYGLHSSHSSAQWRERRQTNSKWNNSMKEENTMGRKEWSSRVEKWAEWVDVFGLFCWMEEMKLMKNELIEWNPMKQ